MIPIYTISLAGETERREHIRQECSRFGLQAIHTDAVDMRRTDEQEIKNLSRLPERKPRKKQRYLTRGELGCALSHLNIYRSITEQQQNYALILEDDAVFLRNPAPLLDESVLNNLQSQYPFDVLILGYVKTLSHQLPYYYRRIPVKKRAALDIAGESLSFGTPWEQYGCGTVAYIVTRQGAAKLLGINSPPCVSADDWLYFERHAGLRVLHARPTFVLEALEKLDSTIRIEKADFLKPKTVSVIIRSIKGCLKNFAMNTLGMK